MTLLITCRYHLLASFVYVAVFFGLLAGAGVLRANTDAAASFLNAELPVGITLENANCPELVFATRQAARKHPAQVRAIMQCAITSRLASKGRVLSAEHVHSRLKRESMMPCECLTRIVQAALQAAPESRIYELVELAMALQPQCAEQITGLLKKPGIDFKDGVAFASVNGHYLSRTNGTDPGSSFGDNLIDGDAVGGGTSSPTFYRSLGDGGGLASFPGAPGFGGNGGAIFPPVVLLPVTAVVNP